MSKTVEYDFGQLQDGIKKLNSLRYRISKPEFNEFWVVGDSGSGSVHDKTYNFSKTTDDYYLYLKQLIDNTYNYLVSSEVLKQVDESIADSFLDDLYGGQGNKIELGNSYGSLDNNKR